MCEHPCEAQCRRRMVDDAVNICGLKRFAVDHAAPAAPPERAADTGKTVAVIGGGPGGMTAAYYLSLMGHQVTVYEQRPKLGGMLGTASRTTVCLRRSWTGISTTSCPPESESILGCPLAEI